MNIIFYVNTYDYILASFQKNNVNVNVNVNGAITKFILKVHMVKLV